MTKTLKRSIGITFILILISALSGGGITLGMAVFSGNYISGTFFLLYILLSFIALIYSSSNVIFALPCKKFLRTLFFVLWLISYSVLSYCLLFAWIFLGFSFSDICWNINYLMNHRLNSVAILMIPLKWFWVFSLKMRFRMAGGNKKASRHFFVPLLILLKKSSLLLFCKTRWLKGCYNISASV